MKKEVNEFKEIIFLLHKNKEENYKINKLLIEIFFFLKHLKNISNL